MAVKIAINGFGRIGRCVTRLVTEYQPKGTFEIVHINDITEAKTLAHLLKYDSVHGKFKHEVKHTDTSIIVDEKAIDVSAIKEPAQLPWKQKRVDLVFECTGKFLDRESNEKHLAAGARFVFLSAPPKSKDIRPFVFGVNHQNFDAKKDSIFSNASCTTNCLAPVAKVLHEKFGIQYGLMTTVHSYTNDQRLLDLEHKDLRRARAAALSMIPTTTGAAKAVGEVLPELRGKLNGLAVRVPTANVSLVDLVAMVSKKTTREEVNKALKEASEGVLKGILGYTEEPVVSIDFNGDPRSSIVDAEQTMVMQDSMVKVLSWYDNEWGFSSRMLDMVKHVVG
jgi:glyceraldehyde 3-phosphate dehydrogenase